MLANRSVGLRTLSLLGLMATVTLSFWVWLLAWQPEVFSDPAQIKRYLIYNEFLLVGILFGSGSSSIAARGPYREFVESLRKSGRQLLAGFFAMVVVGFVMQDAEVSRSFLLSSFPILGLALVFSNHIGPKWLAQWSFSGGRQERVALAGTPEQAAKIKPWLDRKGMLGLRTVGIVCPAGGNGNGAPSSSPTGPYPILGSLDSVGEILQKDSITQLIVMDLELGRDRLGQLAQLCEGSAVRMLAMHDLDSYFSHTTMTFEDDGLRFIGVRDEPLESPVSRFLKRAMDLAVAVPVILLVLPWTTLAVWILHRLQSPGPVFYRQVRSGMMGKPFRIFKYRTMHVNNEEARQAVQGDTRTFAAGRWLRRLSIDELPQFLNVLFGDMSIVGPRPHLQQHEDMWAREMRRYVVRRFIRPGITGWAQVQGYRGEVRTEADIRRRVEADIHYLENWSFSLDCAIVLRTFKHCLFPPRSAY